MAMKEYQLTVDYDQVDHIVKSELRQLLNNMKRELEILESSHQQRMVIWNHDESIERAMIKEHINSAKLLLKYYGERDDG